MSESPCRTIRWWPIPLTETALMIAIVLVYVATGLLDPNHTYFRSWDSARTWSARSP